MAVAVAALVACGRVTEPVVRLRDAAAPLDLVPEPDRVSEPLRVRDGSGVRVVVGAGVDDAVSVRVGVCVAVSVRVGVVVGVGRVRLAGRHGSATPLAANAAGTVL